MKTALTTKLEILGLLPLKSHTIIVILYIYETAFFLQIDLIFNVRTNVLTELLLLWFLKCLQYIMLLPIQSSYSYFMNKNKTLTNILFFFVKRCILEYLSNMQFFFNLKISNISLFKCIQTENSTKYKAKISLNFFKSNLLAKPKSPLIRFQPLNRP